MTLLPRSLLGRTALILAAMLLLTQAVTLYLFRLYYYGPLVEDAAGRAASQIGMVVSGIQVLHEEEREEFLQLLEVREGVRVLFDSNDALAVQEPDDAFLQAFAQRLRAAIGPGTAFFVQPRNARALWVRVGVANEVVWIGIPRAQIERPFPWWWVAWAGTCTLLAVGVAFVLLRRVGRPLRELAGASAALARGDQPDKVAEEGPSEIQHVAVAFNSMLADLRKQDEERAVLLAGISHDLRTPLTRLRLGIELLEGDAATRADMVRDTEEMDGILDQFLYFARPQSAEPFVEVNVTQWLEQACAPYVGRGRPLAVSVDEGVRLHAQPIALRRALVNLIDNAWKYGEGGIDVRVSSRDGKVCICVTDEGRGIPEAARARLMLPFTRLESTRTGAGGAGLGLAITRRIAMAHGGDLRLANSTAGGLVACLEIPVQSSSGSAVRASEADRVTTSGSGEHSGV